MNKRIRISLPLINAHTHAGMVAFRGLGEDEPLDKWLNEYIWPAEAAHVSKAFVYEHTKAAIEEMRANGIAVFHDMYFFAEEVAKAAKEMGMMAVVGEGVLDFPTPSAQTPEQALEHTEKLINQYENDPLIKVSVAPHSIYTLSQKSLLKCQTLADKYKVPLHIHLSETEKEFQDCQQKHGLTPVQYLDSLRMLNERSLLAHCVWLTDEDMDIIAQRGSTVVHCPLSNLKLGSGIASITKLLEKNVNVAMGTDGAASSNRLDIWEAGKIAALLQKGIQQKADAIKAEDILQMMSANGMKALGIDSVQGKNLEDVQNVIANKDHHQHLYHLHSHEIDFE